MKKIALISLLSVSALNIGAPKISDIEITNLNNLEKTTIMELLPIKVGQEYENKLLSDTYLSLLRSGLVYNTNIFPKKDGENVKLELVIDEMPDADKILQNIKYIEELKKKTDYKVKSVSIKGTNIDLKEILSKSNLKEGEYFTTYDATLLRDLIMLSGFFADIEVLLNRDAENKTIDVIYAVKEYPKVRSIKIEGSTLFTQEELIKLSGLKEGEPLNAKLLNPQTSPILRAYAENGFMWVEFVDSKATSEGDIYIKINEGIISNIVFEKKNNATDGKRIEKSDYTLKTKDFVLQRNNYMKKGQILNQKMLELTLRELFRTGLFTSLVPEIYRDPVNPEQFIVKIVATERPTTSISANISYSTEDGLSGSLKLADTNFLGREQNFDLSVESSLKGNYNFNLSFKDPWIQGTDRLLAGGSIYFRKNKTRVKDLNNYNELRNKILEEQKKNKGKDQEEKTEKQIEDLVAETIYDKPTDKQYIFGMNGQIGKGLTKDLYLTSTAKLTNVYSKSRAKEKNAQVYQDYTLASLGADLIYDTRDDRAVPKKGLYFDIYLEGGYIFREKSLKFENGRLVEKTNGRQKRDTQAQTEKEYEKLPTRAYFTTTGDFRAYHPIYKDKNSMAYRLLLNYSHKNTPANQMMAVGDGLTLRGLQTPIGQNEYVSVFSIENRTYINNFLQAVLFYDGGVASNLKQQNGQMNGKNNKLKFSSNLGLGARINTPIGVVRLDYGWDLSSPKVNGKHKGKFNFGFGHTF